MYKTASVLKKCETHIEIRRKTLEMRCSGFNGRYCMTHVTALKKP